MAEEKSKKRARDGGSSKERGDRANKKKKSHKKHHKDKSKKASVEHRRSKMHVDYNVEELLEKKNLKAKRKGARNPDAKTVTKIIKEDIKEGEETVEMNLQHPTSEDEKIVTTFTTELKKRDKKDRKKGDKDKDEDDQEMVILAESRVVPKTPEPSSTSSSSSPEEEEKHKKRRKKKKRHHHRHEPEDEDAEKHKPKKKHAKRHKPEESASKAPSTPKIVSRMGPPVLQQPHPKEHKKPKKKRSDAEKKPELPIHETSLGSPKPKKKKRSKSKEGGHKKKAKKKKPSTDQSKHHEADAPKPFTTLPSPGSIKSPDDDGAAEVAPKKVKHHKKPKTSRAGTHKPSKRGTVTKPTRDTTGTAVGTGQARRRTVPKKRTTAPRPKKSKQAHKEEEEEEEQSGFFGYLRSKMMFMLGAVISSLTPSKSPPSKEPKEPPPEAPAPSTTSFPGLPGLPFLSEPVKVTTSARSSLVTYLTILMIYLFGLTLLPYATTHKPDALVWPCQFLLASGIVSVLLRTQAIRTKG